MPERKNKSQRKVESDQVQGEGSYVIIRTPTLEDVRNLWDAGIEDGSSEFGFKMLEKIVIDWNWVDDEGKPLPNPIENPSMIEHLPIQELVFLLNAAGLRGLAQKAKN